MSDESGQKLVRRFHDPAAEMDLIGLLLAHTELVEQVVVELEPANLAHHAASTALAAIAELWLKDEEISALTVGTKCLELDPLFQRHLLVDWLGRAQAVGSVSAIIERLLSLSQARRLNVSLTDALGRLHEASADPLALATQLMETLAALDSSSPSAMVEMGTAFDIAQRDESEVPWLIPGLLYRQDAVIVVAGEGAGKSLLARQVAVAAEAGLHPFTRYEIPPLRVLTIDLENKRKSMTDGFRMALRAVRSMEGYQDWQPKGPVWEQPGGMNLLTAADRRRFTEAVKKTRPDLVFFGPIYKAFRPTGSMKEDAAALEVTAFLDDLRARFDFGLWLEAHAPFGAGGQHRDLRPFGTTVWQRWPEYGKSFRLDEKTRHLAVGSFRGDRTRVWWPKELATGQGAWPFTGRYEQLGFAGWPTR